jgi:hypothetical protein
LAAQAVIQVDAERAPVAQDPLGFNEDEIGSLESDGVTIADPALNTMCQDRVIDLLLWGRAPGRLGAV